MTKKLKKFLAKNHNDTMENQGDRLEAEMENWIDGTEQTDDMLVIGFKL